jgi:FkbM family methyltransferase
MKPAVKRFIGRRLLEFCERVPSTKPLLHHWGLRTSQSWFDDPVVRIQMPDGRSFKLASLAQNYLSFELFWRGGGYYEPITMLVAQELARSADAFIDIGSNIGFFTLALSTARPGLRVIAFEPNPKNFRLFQANVHLNAFSNVTCEPIAMSDISGTAVLYLSPSDMSASLESDFENKPGPSVKVSTTTLDAYLAQRSLAGRLLIKVDVEGHEAAFFKGARRTISTLKPDIISEVTLHNEDLPLDFLSESGYRFYQITDRGLEPSKKLATIIRGRFRFLNFLLSARPEHEVAGLFRRIQSRVRRIDLKQTSKYVPAEMLQRFQSPNPAAKAL